MALVSCRHYAQLRCSSFRPAGAALRPTITRCQAAGDDSNPEQHSRGHFKALLDGIATARRHGLDWLRRQYLSTRHDDSNQQEERIALVHRPQDVEEVLATLAQRASLQMRSARQTAAEEKASLEALREATARGLEALRGAAVQHTGLTVEELKARTEVLCNLVPGVKEQQLLRLRPEVLREICSDAGASAAAARLVQLRTQDPGAPSEELRAVLRCPRLLTDSGQRSARVTELTFTHLSNLAFAQQGRTLVTLNDRHGKVGVWDLQAAQPSCTIIQPTHDKDNLYRRDFLQAIAVCPDGRHIVVGGGRVGGNCKRLSLLGVIDLETRQRVAEETSSSSSCSSIALVPGNRGKQLVVIAGRSRSMNVWELDLGSGVSAKPELEGIQRWSGQGMLRNLSYHSRKVGKVHAVAAVPGTRSVLAGGESLKLWSNLAGKATKETWPGYDAYKIAVCPQGRLAATTSRWRNVSVWDLQTRREVTKSTAPGCTSPFEPVRCLAISPDGRYMVGSGVGAQRGTLLIWDLQTFERVAAIEASKVAIICLAFSPDGQVLATGHQAGLVRLWDWGDLLAGG